jgi:tetratricopeptide (TPR) repeat protein
VMFINVLYFGSSIVPRTVWILDRPGSSDGALILAALRPLSAADRINLKLEYAWGLEQEGRRSDAEALFAQCRAESPDHRMAAMIQAGVFWRQGKLKEAMDLYSECSGDAEFGTEAKAALALLICTPGAIQDLGRADALSQEILSRFPGVPRGWITRAYVLGALGRTEEATRFLDLAYENLLDPGDRGNAAVLKGHSFVAQGRVRPAEHCLRKALYLGADYSSVRALARALRKIRKAA